MSAAAAALSLIVLALPQAARSQTMLPQAARSQTMLPQAARSPTVLAQAARAPTVAPLPPPPALPVHPAAAGPTLEVVLAPRQATVGDRIEAVLTLRVPRAALAGAPRFPVFLDSWGEAEVLVKGAPVLVPSAAAGDRGEAGGELVTYRQRLVLAAFRPGRIVLPPVAAAVPEKATTVQALTPAGLAFDVRSVLPAKLTDARPKAPAPMRPLPIGAPFWWTLAALAAAAIAGAWALLRRRAPAAGMAAAAPPAAPYPELLAELGRLAGESSSLLVHTRLSRALRRYLGRSLDLPARESTTTEIHRLLQGRRVPRPLVRRTIELLRACDLVKFARQEAGVESGRLRIAAARAIAGELEESLRPQPQPAPPQRLEAAG
jgi:hypothetical protein